MEYGSELYFRLICKIIKLFIYTGVSIWLLFFFRFRLSKTTWPEQVFIIGFILLITGVSVDIIGMLYYIPSLIKRVTGEIVLGNLGLLMVFIGICFSLLELSKISFKLRRRSETDPLTGLNNRRVFFKEFEKELFQARQLEESGPSVAVIDVNKLKIINDTMGHQVGDKAIKAIAEAIKQSIRDYDLAARYGGDEFVILFPREGPRSETLKTRIMKNLELLRLNAGDIPVDFSVGTAKFPDDGMNIEDLLEAADKNMYAGKVK